MAVDKFRSMTLTRQRIKERIKRCQDMRPVMARAAPVIEQMARSAIDNSRSPSGQQFRRLAPSTLAARKPGEFAIPLKKTGRGYAGIRCVPSRRNGLVLMVPGHLRYHMTAGPNRPKRNAFPFEVGRDGRPHPIPKLDRLIRASFRAYLIDMKQPLELPLAAE